MSRAAWATAARARARARAWFTGYTSSSKFGAEFRWARFKFRQKRNWPHGETQFRSAEFILARIQINGTSCELTFLNYSSCVEWGFSRHHVYWFMAFFGLYISSFLLLCKIRLLRSFIILSFCALRCTLL